jgi:predicted DNA-binding protein
MKNVTVRLSDETVETLDEEADDLDLSRAEYLRELIQKGRDYQATEDELEATQNEVERLHRQLQATNARQEDVGELVEYVEQEKSLKERERERRDAPLWRRARWFLFGRG